MITPGTVGFARSNGVMGRLIRFGEMISTGRGDYNHMFVVGENNSVIQAEMSGVTDTQTLDEMTDDFVLLRPPKKVSLPRTVQFAKSQVGIEYGLWTDIGIGIDIVTWQWVPAVRGARRASWICSALGAESLRFGGWIHNWVDIYTPTPQQVFDALLADGATVLQ